MPKPGATGLTRIVKAFGYSTKGISAAFKHEAAFRQEVALFVVLAPAVFWIGGTWLEYAVLIGSLMLVLIVEILNSAIEAVVDRIGEEHHELAGRAKDMGSAAVLLSLLNVIIIWSFVAYHHFFGLHNFF